MSALAWDSGWASPARPAGRPEGVPLRAPIHPGRFLERQYLQPLALSQTKAAVLLGVSRRRVNELIMGHRAMSADTAVRCAMVFGTSATFWLGLQARWDAWQAWRDLRLQMATHPDGLTATRPPQAPTLSPRCPPASLAQPSVAWA
ncbi:HigA family addiction module antitoxin [Ideonella sp.]|jgi:addiction module HigA family antidote|uniref:HigA family addiction module antitoxin n=1 Tax=Ideonella sp. TaxID=1929293 RepID=UPI0037C07CF0